MTTPSKSRQSGIPAPGRSSSIPTPGRSRSSSNLHQNHQAADEDISRAFADALKANDPSQHRNFPLANSASTPSLSPQSVAYSVSSGRRSVVGRPSSVASSSSVKTQERSRTPTSARITSRPPSRQLESVKPFKTFEIDDNVRIGSLGFEGTLKYIGQIDGKPGLWAGVELSGGFSGKGKNDGSVGGHRYFLCPDKCGVFVAATKLSSPTVGPGAIQRPASVASSKGGKIKPASGTGTSGRTTPSFTTTSRTPSASFSNGRITPSSAGGRITPSISSGRITPSSHLTGSIYQRPFKTPTSKTTPTLSDKITAGSRASKYMTMTAQQLSFRDQGIEKDNPPTAVSDSSGSALTSSTMSQTLSSSTRSIGSPFATPRAGYGRLSNVGGSPILPSTRTRTSISTPRARIPSALAMPPPPSPKVLRVGQTPSPTEDFSPTPLPPLDLQDDPIQEKGASRASSVIPPPSRSTSSMSVRSTMTEELVVIEQLQSRLDAAEYENERLRAATEVEAKVTPSVLMEQLQKDQQEAVNKISDLEGKLSGLETLLASQTIQVGNLNAENEKLLLKIIDATSQTEQAIAARDSGSEAHLREMQILQERLDDLDRVNQEKDQMASAQTLIITQLETSLEKSYVDFQEEKRELIIQVDELRVAGQETIALYEERLSAASSKRYELEQRISALEDSLHSMATTQPTQTSASQFPSSATQIDNETLRDQVHHLQKKSSQLEEQLEDARAALERDVTGYQDKISRIRTEDEQRKKDLALKTREVEQLLTSEVAARNRVEEIEEALRESTVALENARGEVEAHRAELANLDLLIGDAGEGDISAKLAHYTQRASADKSQYLQEINRLEQILLDSRAENKTLQKFSTEYADDSQKASNDLQKTTDSLNAENKTLRKQIAELEEKLSVLMRNLEDRSNEIDVLRKKSNRDLPMSNGTLEFSKTLPMKSEPSTEELAGLKHIVQELQKETLASSQHIKMLESENALLSAEAEQLRQEVRILEENLDSSLDDEVRIISSPTPPPNQKVQLETDLDQVRRRLAEAEIKHARTVHGLNKEISELEALVESKIYREDELEQELERLKEKISRQKKMSKNSNSNDNIAGRQMLSSASSSTTSSNDLVSGREEVCEICERPGHDIFNCSLLKDDSGKHVVVCEDCESPGHVAADCPHSLDVF